MRKSKTATLGMWLCIMALAIYIAETISFWPQMMPSDFKIVHVLSFASTFAPAIILIILRILVFTRGSTRVLLPIICIIDILLEIKPIIELIKGASLEETHIFVVIANVALCIVPNLLMLLVALSKRATLFYLPAIIYFALFIVNMGLDYLSQTTNFQILDYCFVIIWTPVLFVTGLFVKEH